MRNVEIRITFLLLCSVLMVNVLPSSILGVKSGDWIRYDFQETFSSVGERWQTIEFLSVVGTEATIRVTIHMSPAIEMNQTETIDLSSSDNFQVIFFGVRVYLIPSNLGVGVPVYLGEFGNQTIAGEATGIVAGANRRLVYANFSKSGSLYTFYWDKQIGVLVEGTMTVGTVYKAVSTRATNMWSGEFVWWPWTLVIITIICGLIALRRNIVEKLRKKRYVFAKQEKEELVRALSSIEFNSVFHLCTPRSSDHRQLSLLFHV